MLCWDKKMQSLSLVEFDRERAITFLDKGKPVIPVSLGIIGQPQEKN